MNDLIEREYALGVVWAALRGEIPFAIVPDIIKKIPTEKEIDNDSSVEYARQRQGASSNRPTKDI